MISLNPWVYTVFLENILLGNLRLKTKVAPDLSVGAALDDGSRITLRHSLTSDLCKVSSSCVSYSNLPNFVLFHHL